MAATPLASVAHSVGAILVRFEQGGLDTRSHVLGDGGRPVAGELPDGAAADELNSGGAIRKTVLISGAMSWMDAVHLEFVVEVLRRPQPANVEADVVLAGSSRPAGR